VIQETRAALGVEPDYDDPTRVPANLIDQQSGIQTAVSDITSSLAQIGIPFDAHDLKPGEAFEQVIRMDSSKGLQDAFGQVVEKAPAVLVGIATVERAERDLENARLRLSWTEIRSEVAGWVQDRQANPGNRVEPGTTLISIRPDYVWIDANFKETQLDHIRIGQPVDLYVDAYPHKVIPGRVAGFNPGTGLSESLLPPENATGNYIKVTQRLPVRIELVEPNPTDTPLFIGLSVVPYIKIKEKPTGPDAGKRIHPRGYRQHPDAGAGPAGSRPTNRIEMNPAGTRQP
jgi:membrane fusion protein (multidrug efflux system)